RRDLLGAAADVPLQRRSNSFHVDGSRTGRRNLGARRRSARPGGTPGAGMSRRARGFTLIEILVALAVVGVGLAALITASGRSTRDAAELRDRTYANWVARNVLAEIRLE